MAFIYNTSSWQAQDQDDPVTADFTPDSDTNLMVGAIGWEQLSPTVTAADWTSGTPQSMTFIRKDERTSGQANTALYYLVNPAIASRHILFTTSATVKARVAAMCYRGVGAGDPLEDNDGQEGSVSSISKTLTATLPGSLGVGTLNTSGPVNHTSAGVLTEIWQGNTAAGTGSYGHALDLAIGNHTFTMEPVSGPRSCAASFALFNPAAGGDQIILLGMRIAENWVDKLRRIWWLPRGIPDGWTWSPDELMLRATHREVDTVRWADDHLHPLNRAFRQWRGVSLLSS